MTWQGSAGLSAFVGCSTTGFGERVEPEVRLYPAEFQDVLLRCQAHATQAKEPVRGNGLRFTIEQ
jgi:hypothetical protein